MGITGSSLSANQKITDHFDSLLNRNNSSSASGKKNPSSKETIQVEVVERAKILLQIDPFIFWDCFLDYPADTFALNPSDIIVLLSLAASKSLSDSSIIKDNQIESAVKSYVQLITELSELGSTVTTTNSKNKLISIDIMVDQLFEWIVLSSAETSDILISYEQFYLGLNSFEKGLSWAMGKIPLSLQYSTNEFNYLRIITGQWLSLADPTHKGSAGVDTKITKKQFFDFCTNRQHVVRRLLESLSHLSVPKKNDTSLLSNTSDRTKDLSHSEVSDTIERILSKPPKGGDEWMANPAWKKTAQRMVPPNLVGSNVRPAASLSLDWVHGYRGFDCRNNIGYVSDKKVSDNYRVLFSTAALTVAQDIENKSQVYFGEHGDDILSLTSFPFSDERTIIASGEIGKTPAIYVYEFHDGQFSSLLCLKGFHSKGVTQLAFSMDGKMLFSVGVDYTVAVYNVDVAKSTTKDFGKMIASAQGPKDKILHVCSGGSNEKHATFLSCGEKHAIVWTLEMKGGGFTQTTVSLGVHKNKFLMCAAPISENNKFAIGTSEGDLLILSVENGKSIIDAIKPDHGKSPINAIWSDVKEKCLLTGSKDGKIFEWSYKGSATPTTKVEKIFTKTTPSTDVVSFSPIRSIVKVPGEGDILIGTQTCEVFTCSSKSAKKLVSGHFKDELWGLAVRPKSSLSSTQEYCTIGDDGILRVWNLKDHIEVFSKNLGGIARTCCFSPDGTVLAVGFGGGGRGKNKEDGVVKIYRFTEKDSKTVSIEIVNEIKEAKQWISVVKFSPDGLTLAVGSRDNSIYLYSVTQKCKKKAKFSKHKAGINQMDFSSCSKYLQSCCSGYEILFSDTSNAAQITDGATKLLNTEWASWTCTLGWPVIGIWSGSMDGSDINAVDKSPDQNFLATSDDFGKVNLFQYPAVKDGGSFHSSYSGHSSHVTCVRWLRPNDMNDTYLISTGGEDKSVFQWKLNISADTKNKSEKVSNDMIVEDYEEFDAPTAGDEFTAVKPWLGAIVPPTAWTNNGVKKGKADPFYAALGELSSLHGKLTIGREIFQNEKDRNDFKDVDEKVKDVLDKMYDSGVIDPSAPDGDELELEWVHGYRGFDCRNNIFYDNMNKSDSDRSIVFYAAALGIVMKCTSDPKKRVQKYFKGHTDDIKAMSVFKMSDGSLICATGQEGMGNTFVWEVQSLKTLSSINTKQKSINMISFSSGDGRLLITFSDDKSVVVSDWKSQTVLVNMKGEPANTFGIAVSSQKSGNLNFVSCGDKHIRYWTLSGRNLSATKVITSPKLKSPNQFYCVVELLGFFFVGSEDGNIYIIPSDGKGVQQKYPDESDKGKNTGGKTDAITAIHSDSDLKFIISGSKAGHVKFLSVKVSDDSKTVQISKLYSFELETIFKDDNILAKQIQSLCCTLPKNTNNTISLIIGTRGCDLLELEIPYPFENSVTMNSKKSILLRSHCNDELWGVATHPTKPFYCSVGDDKTLRFYDIYDKCMIGKIVPLGNISRTVVYSPDGKLLALGFGGRVGRGKEAGGGMIRIYTSDHEKATMLAERRDAKQWISDVKFSGKDDHLTLVAGAHDCKIYIYDVTVQGTESAIVDVKLKLRHTFAKHNSVINHIDLCIDGKFMQSNCSAYELLFCDLTTGKQITSATELRDVKWSEWTCTLGWPVQGIWSGSMDGSDINAVARSHSGHLLATSDDFGKVNLFRYPCIQPGGATPNSYSAHSSHVMNVRWTALDQCLISCGGNDKCLMQWKHTIAPHFGVSNIEISQESSKSVKFQSDSYPEEEGEENESHNSDFFGLPSGGDESGSVKPWLGAIKAPKNPPPINPQSPAVNLDLQWIHGYTSASAGEGNIRISNNLFYNLNNNIVYPAAAMCVQLNLHKDGIPTSDYDKHNKSSMSQSFFKGHNDDILCLAMSKDRKFIASGQTASKGKGTIIIWDALSCRQLSKMENCHQRAVTSLAFKNDGSLLLSVGQDDSNTHILWSDTGGNYNNNNYSNNIKVDGLVFNNFLPRKATNLRRWVHDSNPKSNTDYHFLTGGSSGVNFWKLEGSSLTKKQGRSGKTTSSTSYLCGANLQGKDGKTWFMVLGTSTGSLCVFDDREASNTIEKAHNGAIVCIAEGNENCLFLVSGGKDHHIKVWNQGLQPVSSFDLTGYSAVDATIASIDIKPDDDNESSKSSLILLAGTYGGEIIEVHSGQPKGKRDTSSDSDSVAKKNIDLTDATAEVILHSHFSGELWGLATHPTDPDIFATVGDDGMLRIWSIKKNNMIKSHNIGWAGRSVAWHPTGSCLAVGLHETVKGGYNKKGNKQNPKSKQSKTKASSNDAKAPEPERKGTIQIYAVDLSIGSTDPKKPSFTLLSEGCESIAWISDIKFGIKGTECILAAGSHDKRLYTYTVPISFDSDFQEEWTNCLKQPKFIFNKHSSAVIHFDFSSDGQYIQTNCQAAELLYCSTENGKHETSASKLADYNNFVSIHDDEVDEQDGAKVWSSQTCTLGWPVQGIWPAGSDTSDVNSVDRHVNNKLIATADDFGLVKLFRYPCIAKDSKYLSFQGHSSHVTNVRWTVANHLVSVGGNDKCIFVWHMSDN